mmetsp:Transcript_2256/g.4602  ORF Transcript_2256/g.4602 Transcript_2256/m.4602 type:complete len:367 (-) Transcript_2256:168-1268(-)
MEYQGSHRGRQGDYGDVDGSRQGYRAMGQGARGDGGWIAEETRQIFVRVTAAFGVASVFLAISAFVTATFYIFMYYQILPERIEFSVPVFFDFDPRDDGQFGPQYVVAAATQNTKRAEMPTATVDLVYALQQWSFLGSEKDPRVATRELLTNGFLYDVFVEFIGPTLDDQKNSIGNFMMTVELISEQNSTLARSKRPVLIGAGKIVQPPTSFVGGLLSPFSSSQTLEDVFKIEVVCIEQYIEQKRPQSLRKIKVFLSSPLVQIYSSNIRVKCVLTGVVYYMYYWKYTSFLLFMTVCIVCQASMAYLSVAVFGLFSAASIYADKNTSDHMRPPVERPSFERPTQPTSQSRDSGTRRRPGSTFNSQYR